MREAFSAGPVVKNPRCNAVDTSSILGKLPRCCGTAEPGHPEPVLRNNRGHHGESLCTAAREWLPLTTPGESPCAATKTKRSQSIYIYLLISKGKKDLS